MRTSIRVGVALLLLIGLLGALETAWGQEVTAAIVGSVEDPSGAPIKGAAVVAETPSVALFTRPRPTILVPSTCSTFLLGPTK